MNLEEFSYQFGVNGAENLIAKLNQIETETENLDKAADHLGNTFQRLFDYALRSAIPPAFIKLVMDQAMSFSRQADYIDKLSQTSGIASRTIQQFGYALHRFGGDVNTATAQLDRLQTHFEKFKKPIDKGGGLASELARLAKLHKVDLRGVTDGLDLLKAISVRMEKLSERKKVSLARAFGLDDSTFLMVKNGLKDLEESLYKAQKFVLFDDKDIRQAKEFENTLRDIADNITLISKSFSFGAIPYMQKFANIAKTVSNYLSDHPRVVEGIGKTSFVAGAYGIFRLLNFLPTKFLAGAAGIFGAGTMLGSINEEIDKIDRNYRDKTIIGELESRGYPKLAKYLELIWRAVHDLTTNKSLESTKVLLDTAAKDTNNKNLEKENVDKAIGNFEEKWEEYKEAFEYDGFKGLLARSMISGETGEERAENYFQKIEEIDEAGGIFSFLWKKIESIFLQIRDMLNSKDFWSPIFDKVDGFIDYLKGLFWDLIISVKEKFGMEFSDSDKAYLVSKQLKNSNKIRLAEDIKESSKELVDILTSKDDFSNKKEKIQNRVDELSINLNEKYGNNIASKETIGAQLWFESLNKSFQKQNPDIVENINNFKDYVKNLGINFAFQKEQVEKLYEEYQNSKYQYSQQYENQNIDLSDIVDNFNEEIDLSEVSLEDFVTKLSQSLSKEQIDEALDRFSEKFSPDDLYNRLFQIQNLSTINEDAPSLFEDIVGNIKDFINELKVDLLKRIEVTNPDNELLQQVQSGYENVEDTSLTKILYELLKSEISDIYRNWLSIDKALEKMGGILDSINTILIPIKNLLAKYLNQINEFIDNMDKEDSLINKGKRAIKRGTRFSAAVGLAKAGWDIGKHSGSVVGLTAGAAGGVLGLILGPWAAMKILGFDGPDKLENMKDKEQSIKNKINTYEYEYLNAETDEARAGFDKAIKEKQYELAILQQNIKNLEAEKIAQGAQNMQNMGEAVNSNTPITNDNSQTNNVIINQTINMNGQNINKEEVGKAAFNGTQEGAKLGLWEATTSVAGGNSN